MCVRLDQQRNINSLRVANKTTLRFDGTLVEFGVFTHQRHVDHPIYEYLDYDVSDYGGFARATDDRIDWQATATASLSAPTFSTARFDYYQYRERGLAPQRVL